jgi:hypothetical protein
VNAKLRLHRESDTFFWKVFGEDACTHVCNHVRTCTVHIQLLSVSSLRSASSARNSASSSFTVSHIPGCGSLASVDGATLPRLPAHHGRIRGSLPDEPPRTVRCSLFATENHLEHLYMLARGPGTSLGDGLSLAKRPSCDLGLDVRSGRR